MSGRFGRLLDARQRGVDGGPGERLTVLHPGEHLADGRDRPGDGVLPGLGDPAARARRFDVVTPGRAGDRADQHNGERESAGRLGLIDPDPGAPLVLAVAVAALELGPDPRTGGPAEPFAAD